MAAELTQRPAGLRQDFFKLASRFAPYVRPHGWRLAAAVGVISAGTLVGIGQMYTVMMGINYVVVGALDRVGAAALVLCGIGIALQLAKLAEGVIVTRLNERMTITLRQDLLYRLHRLELSQHATRLSGDWISRTLFEADRFRDFLTGRLLNMAKSALWFLGAAAFLLAIDALVTLPVLALIPVLGVVAFVWLRRLREQSKAQRLAWDKVMGFMTQRLDGLADIQAFGQQTATIAQFNEIAERYRRVHTRLSKERLVLSSVMELSGFVAIALVIFFGGLQLTLGSGMTPGKAFGVAAGLMPMTWMLTGTNKMMASMGMAQGAALSAGALSAFVLFAKRLLNPVRDIANEVAELADARISAGRLLEILDLPEEGDQGIELPSLTGRIEFDHVTFGYEEGRPVLRDITLTIEPGQHVTFVGPTGAGKTSLMNLLSRFYQPVSGAVRVDGYDLSQVSLSSLRRQVVVVPQEAIMFDGAVLENIRFGRPDASDAEVLEAAARIGADPVLGRLPAGYQTAVGERGSRLSVGERQLIALARAMLAEPRIVILDEAVSSVDPASQQTIMKAVHELLRGRTALLVAHQLNLVLDADLVVVVEGGRLVEQGPVDRLISSGGRFAALWQAQMGTDQAVGPELGTNNGQHQP